MELLLRLNWLCKRLTTYIYKGWYIHKGWYQSNWHFMEFGMVFMNPTRSMTTRKVHLLPVWSRRLTPHKF